ncbi:HET-domain-containing protein [Mollisia scopiformis]|uniref:HET-domain-containing protein n=1 Tax=Mollisia scopiformis TaxID=149040 RepID=A0A132BDT3_MOLSC|nr:HET-domain-containing protein [Mollisia scopiformis]KUJ10538.1 HET-domain-containing protein [Mollisia scopiformis]
MRTVNAHTNPSTDEHDPGIQYDVPWRYRLTSTRSENSFKIAKSWLDECHAGKNEHNTKKRWRSRSILQTISRKARLGPKKLKPENPTRLIDIRPDGGKPGEVRLVQAQNRRRKYIALSYCWGKISNPTWTTTKSNMRERMRGLSLSELPPTLFDAISIANGLGVRYIWIDSLCIVQDDPDEWAQEGGRMAGIYRGSVVTVAISSSESALEGAFNKTSTSHLEEFSSLIRIDSKLSDGRCGQLYFYTSCDKGPRERYIQTGPLMQRGWVMQERLLSSRILHYTASQIVWQCDHCFKTEDGLDREGPASLGPGRDFPRDLDYRLSVGELTYLWYMSVVSTYSHKALTYGSDKLVAISAVAKALYSNHKNDYLAGLWRASLISGLLWYRAGPGSKSKEYRSPSWSWASQDSAIYYSIPEAEYVTHYVNECFGDVESVEFECEIIDAEVNIGGPNAFGTVTGGHIRLRAPVISARVLKTPFPQEGLYPRDSYEHELIFWDGFRPIVVPAHMDDDDELKTREVLCAYVGHRRALILAQSTPGVRSYTRIGFGETSEGTELYGTDVFAGLMATAPLGIVTII